MTRPALLLGLCLLGLVGLPSEPLHAARHREEPVAGRVRRLLAEWRIEEAARELRALPQGRQRDPELGLLQGELRFQQGDYAGAAKLLRDTLAGARFASADAAEARALAEQAAATAEATRGFVEQRSPAGRFLLRAAPGKDELLLPYAGEALDRAYAALAQDFAGITEDDAAQPTEPVRVEIYGEVADLARVSTLTLKEIETSGTIALCKWNRLMIVSPRALTRGYPWLDTLTHEYTHYIVSRVSRNSVPIWLHEGLAKFEERRWRGPSGGGLPPAMDNLLSQALARKRFITFEQMYPSMAKLPSQEDTALAFAEVYTVVEYLHQRAGWAGLRKLIGAMASGAGDARAVAATLGVSFAEFDHGWKGWLRTRKSHKGPVALAPRLKFKRPSLPPRGGGPASERPRDAKGEDDDSGEITDVRARSFARLANMLRERRRLSAAATEYEKAQALTGPQNPFVAHKLARTYLELGEVDKAIAAAEPAWELYPDLYSLSVTLGGAWLRKGDMARAAQLLDAANRVNPFDPAIHCGLALAYEKLSVPPAQRAREAAACQSLRGG